MLLQQVYGRYLNAILTIQGSYASGDPDIYTYIRGMRKFAVPWPTQGNPLPPIVVTDIIPSSDTSNSPDHDAAMSAQLARRDLNVVPTFLPGSYVLQLPLVVVKVALYLYR